MKSFARMHQFTYSVRLMGIIMKRIACHWSSNALMLLTLSVLTTSCQRIGKYAEKRADMAAYGNIQGAQLRALGKSEAFTIDDSASRLEREILEQKARAGEATLLSLSDTLAIAMANSRAYQSRKEGLFIQALILTETQKDFKWDTSASTLTASTTLTDDGSMTENFGDNGVDGTLGLAVSRTLASGARVTLNYTETILNYFTSPDTSSESGILSFNIVQPLLNGFGPLVSLEPLRQAERDMIYSVRGFKRYQQDFVIDITSQYYSTLRNRDQLNNALKNYENARNSREQTEAYAKAGRIADFEAAQALQSELNAADNWAIALSNYQSALDGLRFTLGLSVDLNIEPEPTELDVLAERGLVGVDITLGEAIDSAISNRLDLITRRQQVEDQERDLEIRQRDFLPNLDVEYDISKDVENSDYGDPLQELTVGLDIPFDWTEKRNAFRIAQINLERERRGLEEDEDNVHLEVRDLWRKLERNRSVYKNRLLSVKLAERRMENTTLLLKQGKALTRDLLDAQDDLLSSRNEATIALIDYTINRLRFWNAIERFEIDPKGMWYEQVD
jgi:outer membrane protein TolC